uniref:Uncharacterized protein n=1 Tax=Glycine max TaxID=3847 RepID=C6SY74_SOYBN|nr:unknown [Glycine max]
MLATYTKTPVVSQTTMVPDFLESLEIIPELHIKSIRHNLRVFAILVILLSVQKPVWDLELPRVRHHSHHTVQLSSSQLTSPFVHVNISLLASDVGESPSNTLDGGHCEHYLLLPIHVGVQHTQNVLEILVRHQRHFLTRKCCCWRVTPPTMLL